MLKLYGFGRSRWVRPLWMLRELGVEFEAIELSRPALRSEEFLRSSPLGKVPVLVDDGRAMFESGAMLTYLGDKHGRLIPTAGTFERARHDQWMFYTATEIEQPLWLLHKQLERGVGGPDVAERAQRDFRVAVAPVVARLSEHEHLVEEFSAADIMFTVLLCWGVAQPILADFPRLAAYRDRLRAREGFPEHLYQEGLADGSTTRR